MLQANRADHTLYPGLPVSASWSIDRNTPQINILYDAVHTGEYATDYRAIPLYGRLVDSLTQTYQRTGGVLPWAETVVQMASASGAYILVQNAPSPGASIDEACLVPTDVGRQLAFSRHYLSLNATDLSRILLVERPTVYAWLDGKWEPKRENKVRIRKLYRVAHMWHGVSKRPVGKFLREPIDGDASLMDHLLRDPLDVAAINRIFTLICELNGRKAETRQVRSVREIARQREFKPLSSAEESERFDRITRF